MLPATPQPEAVPRASGQVSGGATSGVSADAAVAANTNNTNGKIVNIYFPLTSKQMPWRVLRT